MSRQHRFGSRPSYVVAFGAPRWGESRTYVPYTFRQAGLSEPLFEGRDFSPSPTLAEPDSRLAALDLLGFLTLQPGDTDPEYFADYTPAQLEWASSTECESLAWLVSDLQEWHTARLHNRRSR